MFLFFQGRSRREGRVFLVWRTVGRFLPFEVSKPFLKLAGRRRTSSADFSLLWVAYGFPSKYLFSFSSLVWIIIFEVYRPKKIDKTSSIITPKSQCWALCWALATLFRWYFQTNEYTIDSDDFSGSEYKKWGLLMFLECDNNYKFI